MVDKPPFDSNSDPSKFSIPTVFTKPNVTIHWIEDGQLESIAEVASSWSQAFCCTSLGYILGDLRNIWSLFDISNDPEKIYSRGDLVFFGIFASAVIIFFISGVKSLISLSKNKKTLKDIRSRKSIPINN